MKVHIIDVDSGNICSLSNALRHLGHDVKLITNAVEAQRELPLAERVILPGVGNFGHFMDQVNARALKPLICQYAASGRPLMGICVGLQALFAGSTESPASEGLQLARGQVSKFSDADKSVPHIGWNVCASAQPLYTIGADKHYYFVHSYAKMGTEGLAEQGFEYATCTYGSDTFVAALAKGSMLFTQFHPEKSGRAGLAVIDAFLKGERHTPAGSAPAAALGLTKRVIACLDVRSNDQGDIVVTKGDQYDVREKDTSSVRNFGKPVQVAASYYADGADEVTFLNITSFRDSPLADQPMLAVLRETSKSVFVPLTIGGGIRDLKDPVSGELVPALEVAHLYFRSGADKVSIGSDAVYAAEELLRTGKKSGKTPIETISRAYGAQAVIVSVDPRRRYVVSPDDTPMHTHRTRFPGPNGEEYVWFQCTVRGGREARDLGAWELARAVESLGAGELLLNCIDKDGTNSGFDLELVAEIKKAVRIPVIASSGAGVPQHFVDVFTQTDVDAALGAGMFHRKEYKVRDVKRAMADAGINVRLDC